MPLLGPPCVNKRNVEGLIEALHYEADDDVRAAAARALWQIEDDRAVEPLIAALKDEWWEVREAAAKLLGQIGDERAVEPHVAALWDQAPGAREAAAGALKRLGWQPHATDDEGFSDCSRWTTVQRPKRGLWFALSLKS
jgi:HEAT repeat protein